VKISVPSILQGSIGALVQRAVDSVNALVITPVAGWFNDYITQQNQAFIAYTTQTAVPAEYQLSQIFNPTGSGIIIYLDKITVKGQTTPPGCLLMRTTTVFGGGATSGANKNIGGTASVGECRELSSSAPSGTPIAPVRMMPANTDIVMEFNPPFRLEAGEGINVRSYVQNVINETAYEWREKAT
jgi:hypothetical protein